MRIRIDPMELVETSRVLDGAATEAADIGTQLTACVRCPMPPAVRMSVDHLVATADVVLDSVAVRLHAEAVDLARRAVIAANDSLAAAASVVAPGSVGATANGSVVMLPVTSWELTSIFGSQAVVPITVRSTGLTSMPGAGGVIPITVKPTGLQPLPGTSGTTSIAVSSTGLTSMPGSSAAGPTSERPIRLTEEEAEAYLSEHTLGVSPGAMLLDTVDKKTREIPKLLAPTKLQWEDKLGYQVTMNQYHYDLPQTQQIYD